VQRGELPLRENTYKSKKDKMKIIIKKNLGSAKRGAATLGKRGRLFAPQGRAQ
jgi:hypothetical protein